MLASVTAFLAIGLASALIVSGEWLIAVGAIGGWVAGLLFIRLLS